MIVHLQQIEKILYLLPLFSAGSYFLVVASSRIISAISHHGNMSEANKTRRISWEETSVAPQIFRLSLKIGVLGFKVECLIPTSFKNLEFIKEMFPIKAFIVLENILTIV